MNTEKIRTTIRSWGLGGFLALLVIIGCFVMWIMGKPLTSELALLFISMLALARLL